MKKRSFLVYAGMVLAVLMMLVLAGCPQEPDKEDGIDGRLAHSWTNDPNNEYTIENNLIGLKKTFTIKSDGSFEASINPIHIGAYGKTYSGALAQGGDAAAAAAAGFLAGLQSNTVTQDAAVRWAVEGKLVHDSGDIYFMKNLKEKNNAPVRLDDDTGKPTGSANAALSTGGYEGHRVELKKNTDGIFSFTSASGDENINTFFGGTYTQLP
jgi:hypothetical protein